MNQYEGKNCIPELWAAAKVGDVLKVRQLVIGSGVDVDDVPTIESSTALLVAASNRHENVVVQLLECGASVDKGDSRGHTALMVAAMAGNVVLVTALLANGAVVDNVSDYGYSALLHASSNHHTADVIASLLANGADVNQHSDGGWTALMLAANLGVARVVRLLLAHGADVEHATWLDKTALTEAAWRGHTEVVATLLVHGAAVDQCDWTALMAASKNDHGAVVDLLLASGADVNKTESNGRTALMEAVVAQNDSIVRRLLACSDIDTSLRDCNGNDCLAWTASNEAIGCMILAHRAERERQLLVDIGLALAGLNLPVHLLVCIYEASCVFVDGKVRLFDCWEILKILKQ